MKVEDTTVKTDYFRHSLSFWTTAGSGYADAPGGTGGIRPAAPDDARMPVKIVGTLNGWGGTGPGCTIKFTGAGDYRAAEVSGSSTIPSMRVYIDARVGRYVVTTWTYGGLPGKLYTFASAACGPDAYDPEVDSVPISHSTVSPSQWMAYDPLATRLSGTSRTIFEGGYIWGTIIRTTSWDLRLAPDADKDGIANELDNAPAIWNPDQRDSDGDGIGDAADLQPYVPGSSSPHDSDGDGNLNESDNCPSIENRSQRDVDNDGIGDVCDPRPTVPGDPKEPEADIVRRYAPEVRIHPDEQNFPMDPTTFVNKSRLMWAIEIEDDKVVAPVVDAKKLTDSADPYTYTQTVENVGIRFTTSDQLTALSKAEEPDHLPFGKEGFYLAVPDDVARGNRPTTPKGTLYTTGPPVYYEFLAGRYIIYWLFSGNNQRTGDLHQGDWEKIIVRLDKHNVATDVAYYQHYCEPTDDATHYGMFSMSEMASRGYLANGADGAATHPIVYSGLGGHPSFPIAGTIVLPCAWNDGFLDRMADGGWKWKTWEGSLANAAAQDWYGFGGGWGRKGDSLNDPEPGLGWGPLGPGDVMWRYAPPVPPQWRAQSGEATTGRGVDLTVRPRDIRTGASSAAVNFSSVTAAGVTRVAEVSAPLPPPAGYKTVGAIQDVGTTAAVSGDIRVCLTVDGVDDPARFAQFEVAHWELGQARIRTARSDEWAPNFGTRTLCATTTSLSPFAVVEPLVPVTPTVSLSSSSLNFGAVSNGAGTLATATPGQVVSLRQSGSATFSWTATASAPWISVSPASGVGPATLTVGVRSGAGIPASGVVNGTVTVTLVGAANTLPPVQIALSVMNAGTAASPFGLVDTPIDGSAGLTGSIAVTGWALDDLGVTRVRILRDPIAGEGAALVFIGNAVLVEGARPDVAAAYSSLAYNRRAGWGYLMLTNFLPNEGNGTFRLHAYADDVDGRTTLLGSRTISVANSTATTPFGAIDTPGQGETVSGTVNNFGWVLSQGGRRADVPGGGSVDVFVDGVRIGSPTGWSSRSDLTALFPTSRYDGIGSALAVLTFDTLPLTDGVHTIAWGVTDNQGGAAGIGSRYFTVANGSSATTAVSSSALSSSLQSSPITARRGFETATPMHSLEPGASGAVTIDGEELDRLELQIPGVTGGHLTASGVQSALPIGSTLDVASATFTWLPGAGFVGAYDFIFDSVHGPRLVRIVLHPKGSGRVGPQVVIDAPRPHQIHDGPFTLGGWAADLEAAAGTGIDTVHVWAYPAGGDPPVFVGVAAYGGRRPDVGAVHGERVRESGYNIVVDNLGPGTYDLAVFGFSTVRGDFLPAKTIRVTIK